jgi:hypothetical protein
MPLPQGNLVQYTISAVGTAGERINYFRNPTINPIGASLGVHNVANAVTNSGTPSKGAQTPGLFNPSWVAYDTYFLIGYVDMDPPDFSETNDGTTTGQLGLTSQFGPPRSGFGIYTSTPESSVLLLFPTHAGSNVRFMQVVLRAKDSALMRVRALTDFGEVSEAQEIIIGPFIVPEPATIALLIVPAIGLVVRRRRAVVARLSQS